MSRNATPLSISFSFFSFALTLYHILRNIFNLKKKRNKKKMQFVTSSFKELNVRFSFGISFVIPVRSVQCYFTMLVQAAVSKRSDNLTCSIIITPSSHPCLSMTPANFMVLTGTEALCVTPADASDSSYSLLRPLYLEKIQ